MSTNFLLQFFNSNIICLQPTVDYPVADPIFVKNRYGREDLLALLSKDVRPPDGLEECPFYVSAVQKPIVLTPLSDTETVISKPNTNCKTIQ